MQLASVSKLLTCTAATNLSPLSPALPFPDLYREIGKRKRETPPYYPNLKLVSPARLFPSITLQTVPSFIETTLTGSAGTASMLDEFMCPQYNHLVS